jgi:hypothetical protein
MLKGIQMDERRHLKKLHTARKRVRKSSGADRSSSR